MKEMKDLRENKNGNNKNILLEHNEKKIIFKISKKRKSTIDNFNIKFIKILFPILIILIFTYFILFIIFKRRHNSKSINNFIIFNNTYNNYISNNISKSIAIINNNFSFEYFACFCGIARQENKYVKEFIKYYINLGVEKFIFGDNNLPNTEKLSDILQDYISNGTVDIIEIFNSTIGQSEFGQSVYEKYKKRCGWFLFFDIDEYLEIFFNKNETLNLKQFLSNQIFSNCESILFNWLIYTDNELIFYDNRTLLERFTTPNYKNRDNVHVKSIVRGNLDKIIFHFNTSNHVPSRNLSICDSKGNLRKIYNPFAISPPIFDYGYLKHFTTKTAEEYCTKMKRGRPRGRKYDLNERVKLFFYHNKFSEEKLKVFENTFNMSFKRGIIRYNRHYNYKWNISGKH